MYLPFIMLAWCGIQDKLFCQKMSPARVPGVGETLAFQVFWGSSDSHTVYVNKHVISLYESYCCWKFLGLSTSFIPFLKERKLQLVFMCLRALSSFCSCVIGYFLLALLCSLSFILRLGQEFSYLQGEIFSGTVLRINQNKKLSTKNPSLK